MNVAIATATAARPLAFMTARNSDAVENAADAGTPSAKDPVTGQSEPLAGRYTKTAYRYDADASRLVLLFRSPEDGATLDQIPTEAALRQYREAQKDRKSGKASLELLVGGSDGQDQPNGAGQSGSSANGSPVHRWAAGHSGTGGGRSGASQGTSAHTSPVVASPPMVTHMAAAPSAGAGSVNVVI
ncbi:hypothetical protein D3869_15685 (plasmid) [Azospirillum brasilense]|uniref:Uncharacterized protein n=1 Tax=Azospirillum brasilense TaxID=192 RepID=A0A4D8R278_AZOBR|nr:hypothetical protein [Azospirillum brasilense]QCO16747.1 hypothetical protein D3869_15685 [Azospirillum brasilense]